MDWMDGPTLSSYIFTCIITEGHTTCFGLSLPRTPLYLSYCLLFTAHTVEILICVQRSWATWCRMKRGAVETQPCVREHSTQGPAPHPSMVNHRRKDTGREPKRQRVTHRDNCRGCRWRTNPPSPPLIPHSHPRSVHTTNSPCGGGELRESYMYTNYSNLSKVCIIPLMRVLPGCFTSWCWSIFHDLPSPDTASHLSLLERWITSAWLCSAKRQISCGDFICCVKAEIRELPPRKTPPDTQTLNSIHSSPPVILSIHPPPSPCHCPCLPFPFPWARRFLLGWAASCGPYLPDSCKIAGLSLPPFPLPLSLPYSIYPAPFFPSFSLPLLVLITSYRFQLSKSRSFISAPARFEVPQPTTQQTYQMDRMMPLFDVWLRAAHS